MKRLLLLLFVVIPMLFAYPLSADAMKMSKPIYLGNIVYDDCEDGYIIEGATINTGKKFIAQEYEEYDKGYAVFGKGDMTIYVHYCNNTNRTDDSYGCNVGGKSKANTINLNDSVNITAIRTDSNIVFYCVSDYKEFGGFEILGKLPDGRFVQYADSEALGELYRWWANESVMEYGSVRVENNMIIIDYYGWSDDIEAKPNGEIRFTWDEKAQWFGVEKKKIR